MRSRNEWEHPDVSSALCSGYPRGGGNETADTEEMRREFAEEHQREFFAWLKAEDGEIFDRFAWENGRRYRDWLN